MLDPRALYQIIQFRGGVHQFSPLRKEGIDKVLQKSDRPPHTMHNGHPNKYTGVADLK